MIADISWKMLMKRKMIARRIVPKFIDDYLRKRDLHSIRMNQISSVSMSQAGQDYWVYGEVYNEATHLFFLDIGAHDGVFLSNTFILETRYHWKGICIEANPISFSALQKNRSCTCINTCVDNTDGVVPFALRGVMGGIISDDCDNKEKTFKTADVSATRLDKILEEHDAPHVIDYLSIDIEGAEDRALLDFPFSDYTFNCITIERPSEQLRDKLKINGYLLIKEIPYLDCFFIHQSFKERYQENLFAFGRKRHIMRRWS